MLEKENRHGDLLLFWSAVRSRISIVLHGLAPIIAVESHDDLVFLLAKE